jgi:hypothetical protein
MARKHVDVDKLPPGPELDAVVAEKVMGWKDLKRQSDRYWGKKPDRAGRWRRAAVDDFSCERQGDHHWSGPMPPEDNILSL